MDCTARAFDTHFHITKWNRRALPISIRRTEIRYIVYEGGGGGGFRYRGYEHDTNDGDPLSGFGREGIGGVQISGARDR